LVSYRELGTTVPLSYITGAITVRVLKLAESIREGLKQFTNQVGDFGEQDEGMARIHTDKVCLDLVLVFKSYSNLVMLPA